VIEKHPECRSGNKYSRQASVWLKILKKMNLVDLLIVLAPFGAIYCICFFLDVRDKKQNLLIKFVNSGGNLNEIDSAVNKALTESLFLEGIVTYKNNDMGEPYIKMSKMSDRAKKAFRDAYIERIDALYITELEKRMRSGH
jgi:hypothetical protein